MDAEIRDHGMMYVGADQIMLNLWGTGCSGVDKRKRLFFLLHSGHAVGLLMA